MSGDERRSEPQSESGLGACPLCDDRIPSSRLLVRYETAGCWERIYAECPYCTDVVHPV